jgi:hypothetical protein
MPTVAEILIDGLRRAGVQRIFGVPGGGPTTVSPPQDASSRVAASTTVEKEGLSRMLQLSIVGEDEASALFGKRERLRQRDCRLQLTLTDQHMLRPHSH